jgi:hypothetical protein
VEPVAQDAPPVDHTPEPDVERALMRVPIAVSRNTGATAS